MLLPADETLSAGTAFASIAIFGLLKFPLTMFPNMLASAAEARLAVERASGSFEPVLVPEHMGRVMDCCVSFCVSWRVRIHAVT